MPEIQPPLRETYKGLFVHYFNGHKDKPSVVVARDIWIPGKELGWMLLLNRLGLSVSLGYYRGTWWSPGEFLSNGEGNLSVTEDISDLIRFSIEKFGSTQVYILAYSFGCIPGLMACTRFEEVSKIFTFGAPIRTNDPELNRKYEAGGDSAARVGENLNKISTKGGYFFDGYTGFSLEAWNKLTSGRTRFNPYKFLDELANKQIFAMHATNDKVVHFERTTDFVRALKRHCQENGIEPKIELGLIVDGRGHRTGFGLEEQLQAARFLAGALDSNLVEDIRNCVDRHRRRFQRPNGEWFDVPFYDLVVHQIREFQEAGLLHKGPRLEEIMNEIF